MPDAARPRVAIVGCGAIGGYVGALMTQAGEDVVMIDPWPEHVEQMRRRGARVSGTTRQESAVVRVNAMHVCDVQALTRGRPVDVAFIAVKSYDSEWAAALIKPYLATDGVVVSLQNCINEDRIAGVVGWGKVLGVAIPYLAAEVFEPGLIKRTAARGDAQHVIFRVGEVHGRVTPRVREVARLLSHVDVSIVTTNLWGERWSKLAVNAMRNGLCAAAGIGGNERDGNEATRRLSIFLGSEAVRVGESLGYALEPIVGIAPETLARAGEGDAAALAEAERVLVAGLKDRSDEQRPSMAQDIAKGRRTETDYINGYVAATGDRIGVPAPKNDKLNGVVKRVERGELAPAVANVSGI